MPYARIVPNRVSPAQLAHALPVSARSNELPVSTAMTPEPVALDAAQSAHDAAIIMLDRNIHHLPITAEGELVGMVARSDFMRLETEHPLYLVSDIGRQSTTDGVVAACQRLPGLIIGQMTDTFRMPKDFPALVYLSMNAWQGENEGELAVLNRLLGHALGVTDGELQVFTVPTVTFRVLYVLLVMSHDRRKIIHFNVTEHPTAQWTAQQIVEALPRDPHPDISGAIALATSWRLP